MDADPGSASGTDHAGTSRPGVQARSQLLQRYLGAIHRYLLATVKDPDAADELFQEFALKFSRGDFRNADPGRGQFRKFVKTALLNLIRNYWQKQARSDREHNGLDSPGREPVAPDAHEVVDTSVESWREEMITRTWEALAREEVSGGPPCHSVLKLKADIPGIRSAELSQRLNAQLTPSKPWTESGIRKVVQRSRARFAELLVAEVRASLESPSLDELEHELIDTGLLPYCRSALEEQKKRNGSQQKRI